MFQIYKVFLILISEPFPKPFPKHENVSETVSEKESSGYKLLTH